jgi:hypothetical protein
VKGPWQTGDVELSAVVRILDTEGEAAEAPRGFGARLLATALVRLPTGAISDPDTLLNVGTGDGQMDFEGRLLGQLAFGGRLGLHLGGRYGVQQSRTLVQRVAAPETVLAPSSTRQIVEWTPGAYFGVEIAPVWRFTDELDLVAEYRLFRKYRDTYTLAGTSVGAGVDTGVLEVGGTRGRGKRRSDPRHDAVGARRAPLPEDLGKLADADSSSRACALDLADSGSPPSMRAISCTRASAWSGRTSAVVVPSLTAFSTKRWWSPRAATCARWVTTNT